MFSKIDKTAYPPKHPMMVFDGDCSFCKYWIVKWKKITLNKVIYQPYQKAADLFPDIPIKHFKQAVRFIDTNGQIANGPEAAYITYRSHWFYSFLFRWYLKKSWFEKLSDVAYQWVADHRSLLFKISKLMFGKNAERPRPYWLIFIVVILLILILARIY